MALQKYRAEVNVSGPARTEPGDRQFSGAARLLPPAGTSTHQVNPTERGAYKAGTALRESREDEKAGENREGRKTLRVSLADQFHAKPDTSASESSLPCHAGNRAPLAGAVRMGDGMGCRSRSVEARQAAAWSIWCDWDSFSAKVGHTLSIPAPIAQAVALRMGRCGHVGQWPQARMPGQHARPKYRFDHKSASQPAQIVRQAREGVHHAGWCARKLV